MDRVCLLYHGSRWADCTQEVERRERREGGRAGGVVPLARAQQPQRLTLTPATDEITQTYSVGETKACHVNVEGRHCPNTSFQSHSEHNHLLFSAFLL